jgi:hypothetical protein
MMPPAEIRNFLAVYDDACHFYFSKLPLLIDLSRYREDNQNKYIMFLALPQDLFVVTLQVGQSGKVVSPKLYIAVALSGAMSHIAGCMGSKVIVAINKDKEANIFSVAHFGIVGDYKEVLPALTAKLKELKSK